MCMYVVCVHKITIFLSTYRKYIQKIILYMLCTGETELERERYFKELAHGTVEAHKSKICKAGRQNEDPGKR